MMKRILHVVATVVASAVLLVAGVHAAQSCCTNASCCGKSDCCKKACCRK